MYSKLLVILFLTIVSCLPSKNPSEELSSLRIRASTLRNNDADERALNHRLLHNEINSMEGEKRLVSAQNADIAMKEEKKQNEAAELASKYRQFRPKDESDEVDSFADIEAEIAAKKAYLKRIHFEEDAAKQEQLNEERIWKLRHLENTDKKKKKTDKKFDAWFESLFEKLWKEMFGPKKDNTDEIAQKLLNNPNAVVKDV